MMCKSNRPFIPANDYRIVNLFHYNRSLNEWPVGFAHNYLLVFGNSLTKHNKLRGFSCSVVIFPPIFPHTALHYMLTLPISHVCLGPVIQVYMQLSPRPRRGLRGIVFTLSLCLCIRPNCKNSINHCNIQ